MQYRTLRRVVLSFAVMIVAVGSLTLIGCGGDDADSRIVNQTIPLDAANAATNPPNTEVVEGRSFVVSGDILAARASTPALQQALRATTPTLGFTNINGATGNFTLQNPTASGTVRFASCLFTILAPAALAGTISIENCSATVTTNGVEVELGGDTVTAFITLSLNGSVAAATATAQVSLSEDGQLFVDGVPTTIIISTGTSGG